MNHSTQTCYRKSPSTSSRPKTPKSEGSNVFRIPSPMFITTQNLTRIPVQRKKDRILSSHSLTAKDTPQSNQLTSLFLASNQVCNNGRKTSKYLPNNGTHYSNNNGQDNLQQNINNSAMVPSVPVENFEGYSAMKSQDKHNDVPDAQRVVNRAQVYLPGDHVIFAESPSAPGIPIIYRPEDERQSNPDKLNLDRRKLTICPILEGEENLRLLNYQHNYIKKIEHLSMLTKLIFLDLYNNQIEEIYGLSSLRLLRVLMLGKNRVRKIANLEKLTMLDVLDLHGNQISKIENVDHLRHLRVLNLAGNVLTVVENLVGLASLSELNLRRNSINSVYDIDELPCLQRLFLSFNDITTFHDIKCLSKSLSLVELSLDGNPYSKCSDYKQMIIQNVTNLRQLDMKRLTDEEKRFACLAAKREEERRKELERSATMKEKRYVAISNAEKQWNRQMGVQVNDSYLPSLKFDNEKLDRLPSLREGFSVDQSHRDVDNVKSVSATHLAEVDNNTLNLYGHRSLEALEKDWGEKVNSTINAINFNYINFHDIRLHLDKLYVNFPSLKRLNFDMTNITSLHELDMFSLVPHLDDLQITPEGNSLTKLSLWKPYIIYHLSRLQLKMLNGKDIGHSDVLHSKDIFGSMSHIMPSKLPSYRVKMLKSANKRLPPGQLVITVPLWADEELTDKEKVDNDGRKQFSASYVREVLQNAVLGYRKIKLFDEYWNEFLLDMVSLCIDEMSDLEKFSEAALEKIMESSI